MDWDERESRMQFQTGQKNGGNESVLGVAFLF